MAGKKRNKRSDEIQEAPTVANAGFEEDLGLAPIEADESGLEPAYDGGAPGTRMPLFRHARQLKR